MKKIHKIAVMLAMLMPTMALAGGSGSTTYNYSATVNVAASGSGTVYVGAGTSATDKTKQTATQSNSKSSDTSKTYTFTAVAEPEEGYEFTGWTGGADNASSATTPVTVSLSSSTTSKTVDLTATFAKIISFDGAEYVIDENGGDLATLLGSVQAGDTIVINKDVTIEKGVSLTIPSSIQVAISSGKKLIVKGNLSIHNDARLVGEGTLAHNWKTITQAADVHVPFPLGTDGVAGTGNGVNTVDGTAGKYLVTSVAEANNVSGSFTCKEEFFVTVENKASGETYYSKPSTSKPVGVLCTVAREKALNWIEGVSDTIYTDCATLLTAAATPSGVAVSGNKHSFKDTNKLAVLTGAAGTVTYDGSSSSSSTKLAFTVDLAGTSITLSTGKQWNSQALVRFFNGSVTITQKVMNTNFCVYNCTGKISYLSLNSGDYVTAAYLYESPRITITFSDKQSTSSGELCFFGGGPYSTSYVSFNTTVSDKQAFNKVYWGTFASGMNPTTYLYDTNKVYAEQDSNQNNAWVVKSKVVDPNAGQVLLNGEESTFANAIANAPANAAIVLQKDVELSSDQTLTATGVRIDLNGWKLTGSNAIINNGDLEIIDVNGNGQIDVPVINNGTLLLSSAKYNGPITLNGGFCYFLAGSFNGVVAVASGVEDAKTVAEVCGGTFATLTYAHGGQNEALVGLCENGYVKDNAIAPIPVSYVTNPSFASYSLSAFDSTTKSLYTRNAARSGYTREEWIELCKLKAASALFSGFGVDCAVTFDRAIAANDISVNAMGLYPFDIDEAIAANKAFSALFQAMRRSDMATAPWTYGSILPGGAHDGSLSFSLSNKTAQNGTLCLVEMRLATGVRNMSGPKDWSYTEYVTTAKQKLVLGNAGSNKAMIRPATGAATFYATLGAAMDAVADGGTVMLANDCDTALALNKAGTYTFDTMGFAYSGGEPAVGSGLRIASVTTNATESSAKVLVPDAMTISYVIENAGTIECGETKYVSIEAAVEASSGDTIAVTVTADDTETVTLPQGKTLTVTVNDGVEANVTVNPGEGSFIETETCGSTTTYVAKQITVEMAEPQSQVEVVKVDHGVTNEVSDASLVNEAVHALTGNHDVSRTDNTDKLDVLDKITVTPAKIVEEVVGDKTIIRSVTFDVVPHLNAGQTLGEGQTLKFRLPVDAAATQLAAIVYHGTAQFGIYPVQTYNNEKFIEVTSADFSPYSYELLDGETSNPIAAIGTTGYATLVEAVAAVPTDGTETTITMLAGETIAADAGITIASGKNIVLDLNGQTVQMAAASADERWLIKNEGTLTVKDSAENGKLLMSATGQASTAVRKSTIKNMGALTVESGTIELTYSGTNKEEPTAIMNDASDRATSLTVKGGTVVNSANRGMGVFLAVNDMNATVFDVQDGRVEGYGAAVRYYFDDRNLTDAKLTFNMSDGTIHGRGMYGVQGMSTSSRDWNGISFNISGGTISCAGLLGRKSVISPLQGTVSISGGTFAGDVYVYGHALEITDGDFAGNVTLHRTKESLESASISGGQFSSGLTIAETTNDNTTNPYYNAKFITGGIYGTAPEARNVVDEYAVVDNTDSSTQGDYPKTIGGAVASVTADGNTTYYATFADAIAAANAANVDEITILNGATESPDAGWKVSDGKLVRKVYVAQNTTGVKYESLDAAIQDAQDGDAITLLMNVETSVTIHKSLILTGNYKITGTTKVTDGASVVLKGVTLDANGLIYALDIAGGASVAMTNVTVGGGQWCNVHVNGGTLTGTGVTMLGDEIAVAADGQTYTYRGETHDASDAPFGMDLSKVTGKTVTLPFMDIVRENGDETVSLSDAQNKPLTQAGSILYLANMPGNDSLDGVTLPDRFYSYTLTIEADIGFLGDGTTPTTGWAAGDWNEIINTGTLVLDAIGEDSDEVPVLLTLNDDTDLGEEPFEFRYGNLTVDGDGNVLFGTIVYTDNAGVVSNAVLGTADTPLVIDLTQVTDIASLGDGIVVENVVLLVAESHAADGTEIFAWDPEAGEPSIDQSGRLSVVIVDENGSPTGDAATLTFDMEAGVAYLGTCVARLTGPTHEKPIYSSLAGAIAAAANEGDTVTLLADIADYTGTTLVSKSLTINGAGHSITAAAVPEGGHRDMINAFTGGTSMLKIGGGAVTVTNITFNGHATHAYTYLIEVVNSGASLTVGDISLVNGGELDNSGTPGAGYGAAIHVNNASIVVKDGFYACTGGAEYGVFPFTGILPEGNASVMFDLVEDSDDTPTVDIDDDLLLVGMIGAIDPDTAQAILDYMQVPSRFIPYTLTLGDGSDYAFTGASPRTWNDIIDYGKEIMDVSTSLGYEGLDKESTPVEVGLLADTELPGTFVFEDSNFTVNGNGNELKGTIKYTANAGELKNVVLTSDTILDISAEGAAVKFGDNVTIKAGEAVTLVVGDLSSGQTLVTHVGGLSLDSVVLKTWDGDNLVDAEIPEGLVLIEVDGNLIIAAAYEITWVSEGEILAVDVVISNTVPVYAGEPPVKDADDNGIYIFRGWTPKVEAAVSNTTYTANFSNSCTIRWMTGDTIVKSVSVTNGTPAAEIAAMAPSGASSPDGNARFAGWSPAVYADALGDADYIAQFEALDTLASIVPGTLRFTAIKVNGRKVAVTFEFKPAGGETDAYRLICKTALDSAGTFVSDIANVTVLRDDANISIAIAEVQLPKGCENQAFVTGLDFVDVE